MSQPPYPPPGGDEDGGGQSGPAGPLKGGNSTLIALLVAGVALLAVVGVALYLVSGRGDGSTVTSSVARSTTAGEKPAPGVALPDPTVTPEGLGDDPVLDVLAQGCYLGNMRSCDDLFDESDPGSDYETYGDTCAGRQPTGTLVYCTDTFP